MLKINGLYPCCLHISSFERQIHYTLSFNPIYDKSICLTKLLWRKMHHGPIKLWNGTCNTLHRTYKWHHFKILFPARMQLNYISLFIGMKTQHTNSCWAGANFSIFQAKIWNHVLYIQVGTTVIFPTTLISWNYSSQPAQPWSKCMHVTKIYSYKTYFFKKTNLQLCQPLLGYTCTRLETLDMSAIEVGFSKKNYYRSIF